MSSVETMKAKAKELILALQNAPAFDATNLAHAVNTFLLTKCNLTDLSQIVGSRDGSRNDDFFRIGVIHPEFKNSADQLGAATLALGLSYLEKDEYGFVDSASQENAKKMANDSLANMIPYLIEEHIDRQLGKVALATLYELAKNADFKEAYSQLLKSDDVQLTIAESGIPLTANNYRANLLYVYEYFRAGKVPYIHGNVPAANGDGSFADVVKAWLHNTIAPTENMSFVDVFNKVYAAQTGQQTPPETVVTNWEQFSKDLMQVLLPSDIVYLPALDLSSGLPYIVDNVLASVAPQIHGNETLSKSLLTAIPNQTVSFAFELWVDWEKQCEILKNAAQTSINMETITDNKRSHSGVNPGFRHLYDVKDHEWGHDLSRAQIRCKNYNVWNLKNSKLLPAEETMDTRNWCPRTKNTGFRWHEEEIGRSGGSSCFIPGTTVLTSRGEEAIESLQENASILTRAHTQEYGVKSSEVVRLPTEAGSVFACGFNDEAAFFTANHVFFTTTGKRAVDPESARRENPWLEVGELRVGHILLRTVDGTSYEAVQIERIHVKEIHCDAVYGVHLREGLRSYHANGFLVHLNYPEITIRSIADMLREVSAADQIKMLKQLEELQPIISRFGQGTVLQLLKSELAKTGHIPHMVPDGFRPPSLYFQNRSFELRSSDNRLEKLASHYQLPRLDCFDGQVWLDGSPCDRARILERGVTWSRKLADTLWEHSMCTFGDDYQMTAGDGLIWLETSSEPSTPSQKPIPFKALSTALRSNNDEFLAPIVTSHELAATEIYGLRMTHPKRDVQDASQDADEESTDLLKGVTSITKSTEAFDKRQQVVEKISGPTPRTPVYTQVQPVETYDVFCNPDSLTEGPTGREPVRVFQVVKVRKDNKNGATSFDFSIPALDTLATQLAASLPDSMEKIVSPLYSTEIHRNEKHEFIVSIKLDQPERVALAADDNIAPESYGEKAKTYEDLKFTKHGISEMTLPFLFERVVFTTNTLLGILGGQMIEFDPTAVGDDGDSHIVNGKKITAPVVPTPQPGEGSVVSPTGPTSAPAGFIQHQRPGKSPEDLIYGLNINTTQLKEDTQKVLYRTMLYHMDEKDRRDILKTSKPTVSDTAFFSPETLPSDLADNLDPSLRAWIKDKYAMAWIAQNIAYMPDDQKAQFNIAVDAKTKKRLNYFMTGSGKNCLPQSMEYNNLNTQVAVSCFRRKYVRVLEYIRDKAPISDESTDLKLRGMTGGKKWAHLLFESLIAGPMVKQIARESALSEITRINTLEKYCTLLNALWIDPQPDKDKGSLGKQLATAVEASLHEQHMFKHRAIGDPVDLENGMRDYLLTLFELILDEGKAIAAGIANEFRQAMIASMKSFCDWDELYQKRTARQNAEAMLNTASAMIKGAATYAVGATDSPEHLQSGIKAIARGLQVIRRKVLGIKGDYKGQGSPPAIQARPWTGGLCFLLGLAFTAVYIQQSWKAFGLWISDEHKLSPLDKTRLVASGLQALGGLVFTSYKALQIAKGWDPRNLARTSELTHSVAAQLEMATVSRSMHLHPDAVLENTDFATRARRNAITSRDMALGSKKPKSIVDAMLPDSKKPISFKERATSLKNSVKAKVKGWGKAIQAKSMFNVGETILRGICVGLSVTMLVLACITAGQLYGDQEPVERLLVVINLLVQFANLIIEIATIFCAVPVYIGMTVLIVGLVMQILISRFVGDPKAPTPAVVAWFNSQWALFIKSIPEEPQSRIEYKAEVEKLVQGQDTTITVIGKPRDQGPDNGFSRLTDISVRFTASATDTNSLFNSKSRPINETLSTASDLQSGDCSIILPESLKKLSKDTNGKDRPLFLSGLSPTGTGSAVSTYELGVQANQDMLTVDQPMASIQLTAGEQLVLKMRGVVANAGERPVENKVDYKTDVPPWRQYELRVVETYSDDKGDIQGMIEVVINLEKLENSKQ